MLCCVLGVGVPGPTESPFGYGPGEGRPSGLQKLTVGLLVVVVIGLALGADDLHTLYIQFRSHISSAAAVKAVMDRHSSADLPRLS